MTAIAKAIEFLASSLKTEEKLIGAGRAGKKSLGRQLDSRKVAIKFNSGYEGN